MRRYCYTVIASFILQAFWPQLVAAQTPAVAASTPSLQIKQVSWRFGDATSTLTPELKQSLVQKVKGIITSKATVASVDALAEDLTLYLRSAGYMLAQVLVTDEDLKVSQSSGDLRITVLEGKVGEIKVTDTSANAKSTTTRLISTAFCGQLSIDRCSGAPILDGRIDRAALLVRELPNTAIDTPAFSKGKGIGEGDINLNIRPAGSPYTFNTSWDNFGSPSTGRTRMSFGLDAANALGLSESIFLSATTSNQELKTYALGSDWLINRHGTRAGFGASKLNVSLSGVTANTVSTGYSWSGYMKHPVVRTLHNNTNAVLTYSSGRSHTNYLGNLLSLDGSSSKWVLGMNGQWGDRVNLYDPRLASNLWAATLTSGKINLDPSNIAADASGAQTQGAYQKLGLTIGRTQPLDSKGEWAIASGISVQQAGKNLDNGEKMGLGGPNAVRAYPGGEMGSDNAAIINIDLKRQIFGVQGGRLSASVFTDYAKGQLIKNNYASSGVSDAANRVSLNGTGVGLTWARRINANQSLTLIGTVARQGGATSTAEPNGGRSHFYLSAQAQF